MTNNYYKLWKKKNTIFGTTPAQSMLENSRYLYGREFQNDPSYSEAVLHKHDLTSVPIGVRIINLDTSPSIKHIQMYPITECIGGEYIVCRDKIYIVNSYENNLTVPYVTANECTVNLQWKGLENPIPCTIENNSYGSKGEVHNYTQQSDFDARALITVQKNIYTDKIYEGMRFIFNNNDHDVYEITKKQGVYSKGRWQLVCKFTKVVAEDDFVNGIAYNPRLEEDINITNCKISGDSVIPLNTIVRYDVVGGVTKDIDWTIECYDNETQSCQIVQSNNEYCLLQILKDDMYVGVKLVIKDKQGNWLDEKEIITSEEYISKEDKLWDF